MLLIAKQILCVLNNNYNTEDDYDWLTLYGVSYYQKLYGLAPDVLSISLHSMFSVISELVDAGLVIKSDQNLYRVSEYGKEFCDKHLSEWKREVVGDANS